MRLTDIRFGALSTGAFILLGSFCDCGAEAKSVMTPLPVPSKKKSVSIKPAQTANGAPSKELSTSKPIQHPTDEERTWVGRVSEFGKIATALEDKLKAGEVDASVSLMPSTIADSMGLPIEQFVREQLVPFFSDYKESNNRTVGSGVRENGVLTGFAFYKGFRTKSGEPKYYLLKVLTRDGRPTVTAFKINWQLADDDPERAQQIRESSPQVESIRPSDSSRVIWSAPGTK